MWGKGTALEMYLEKEGITVRPLSPSLVLVLILRCRL
jgi:hypothetical protein